MTKLEAYRILSKMWNDVTQEQEEAINIAMDAIEFMDLMPKDMVAVVRCKDCKHHHYLCLSNFLDRKENDFCSCGERRDTDG